MHLIPNVTQEGTKQKAWKNGAGLYHQFTYYGITVTYATGNGCNTKSGLIKLLEEHPEGIVIYIRDLPHAVLLTRYDMSTDEFYVADPVYEGERTLMTSWQRKAGSNQNAVIRTIDAYWYISKYEDKIIPGGLIGNTTKDSDNENVIDDELLSSMEDEIVEEELIATIQLPYINNFNETNFLDVDNEAWYISYIKAVYEMGLMIGVSEDCFHIDGNITLAQTICIAARIHSLYYNNGYEFENDGKYWYTPYVSYAIANDIYAADLAKTAHYDKEITKIEFVDILSKALPPEELIKIKEVDEISDVPIDGEDERFNIIYMLYNAGILVGDGEGFKPNRKITRAEIAAVVSRMGDVNLRIVE